MSALIGASVVSLPSVAYADVELPVELGAAGTYAVLSGASIGNTVSAPGAPHTVVRGDLGVSSGGAITGFPPGVVTGTIHAGDSHAVDAQSALAAAFADAASRTPTATFGGDLIGQTLTVGVYRAAAAISNTGLLKLDAQGDANAVFILQVGGALTMAAGSEVRLTNGTRASRVFWQVNGAVGLGAQSSIAGTMMAMDAIGIGAGTTVNGRALARTGAVALDNNSFYSMPPVVTITGGAAASTTDSSPTITGTTDVMVGSTVTVTIGAEMATTLAQGDGTWSLTWGLLVNGLYSVTAAVTDPVGNVGNASQTLTVDNEPPVVAIDGGATSSTIDSTPTVTGTTDIAPGATLTMSVTGQTFTTLVQGNGTWNVTPASLADGSHVVTASVTDAAGNVGSASQTLTVASAVPPPVVSPPEPSPVVPPPAAIGGPVRLTPILPTRLADTRSGFGWYTRLSAHGVIRVKVAGSTGIPIDVTAAVLNVTAVGPDHDGYLTVYPCTPGPPATSTLNFARGRDIANSTIAMLAPDGHVCVYSSVSADVIVDVTAWLSPSGSTAMTISSPRRVADTRSGLGGFGRLSADRVNTVSVGDESAAAAALNVTAVGAGATGFLTVFPCGTNPPEASTVNFAPDEARPNNTIVAVAPGGLVCVFASAPVDVIVDVTAVFSDAGALEYVSASPQRLLDTRATGVVHGGTRSVFVATSGATKSPVGSASALSVNVTATDHTNAGFATAFDCGATIPNVSTLNQRVGEANANGAIVPISAGTTGCVFTSTTTNLIVDLNGWWVAN